MDLVKNILESPTFLSLAGMVVYHEIRLISIEMVLGIGRFKDLKSRFKKGG
jgi:hypothetical protein